MFSIFPDELSGGVIGIKGVAISSFDGRVWVLSPMGGEVILLSLLQADKHNVPLKTTNDRIKRVKIFLMKVFYLNLDCESTHKNWEMEVFPIEYDGKLW